jgi:serine/threonine protein phosphatase PrpC
MMLPARFRVGVCSHAGAVRTANEDDYLIACAGGVGPFFVGVADGMGGHAGGAEASRTALRAIAAEALAGGDDATARMQRGFAAAARRIADASAVVPALRGMGTTATAVCFDGDAVAVGHVGDSRLYRVRDDRCERLTEDHAAPAPENLLTRCIGGGRDDVAADVAVHDVAPGDRFVLVSDGVWNVVPEATLARLAARREPQEAAEELVRQALALGGPDNATAVVVEARAGAAPGAMTLVDLPRDERPDDRSLWPRAAALPSPAAPWALLAAGVALLAFAALRALGVDVATAMFRG